MHIAKNARNTNILFVNQKNLIRRSVMDIWIAIMGLWKIMGNDGLSKVEDARNNNVLLLIDKKKILEEKKRENYMCNSTYQF